VVTVKKVLQHQLGLLLTLCTVEERPSSHTLFESDVEQIRHKVLQPGTEQYILFSEYMSAYTGSMRSILSDIVPNQRIDLYRPWMKLEQGHVKVVRDDGHLHEVPSVVICTRFQKID
jgi:hypothetical protein